jgi:uncharacterized protein YegL
MRRLPVFFVLDCSESMAGEGLRKMEDGLQGIVRSLRANPHALETVHISVIAFAGLAKTIVPLVELFSFYPPKLPLGGGTSLGGALEALMGEIDASVQRTTAERKGDWRPVVYLFTDGRPTDDPGPAIERWRARYAEGAALIAVGIGADVDFAVLKRLTDQVLLFDEGEAGDFARLVDWVSASILARSQPLGAARDGRAEAVLDTSVLRLVKEPPPVRPDAACVTLVGRCQNTRRAYLIKYERERREVATGALRVDVSLYRLAGCYPLEEAYFDWSDPRTGGLEVSTSELLGVPGCPHCGNATAFALCGCGRLLCVGGPGEAVCPWCGRQASFSAGPSPDEGGFAVGRGLG